VSEIRAGFLAALRAGLRGAPAQLIDEVTADYAAHFDDGVRHGRSDDAIAMALGDPQVLADELRAAAHVSRWERAPSPRSGWRLFAHALSRGALRGSLALIAVPLLCLVALVLTFASLAALAAGTWFLFAGHAFELPGGTTTVLLAGFGMLAGGVSLCALSLLGGVGLVNGLARAMRNNQRQIQDSKRSGASS
jgi:uncharacterized membrane protein